MSYRDAEQVNEIVLEDRHQQQEEQALRNKILSMHNQQKKQELWRKYFHVEELTGNEVY